MNEALSFLERTIPFCYLDAAHRTWLASRLTARRAGPGQPLLGVKDQMQATVFIVARGSVDLVQADGRRQRVLAGQSFGERAALLDEALVRDALAGETGADAFALSGHDLLALLDESTVFAQALSAALVQKQKIFDPYRQLQTKIVECTHRGTFFLSEILPCYQTLEPALHPKLATSEIDVDALKYAVMRLPAEVTHTTFWFLSDTIPELYSDPDRKFTPISPGKARRRSMWELMPGKLLVLVRDGLADVTDLISCLCLFATEARKLRKRIGTDKRLRQLAELVRHPDLDGERRLLDELPLSDEERAGLLRTWPTRTAERLREVLLLHEDIAFDVHRSIGEYTPRASEAWVAQIRAEASKIVDLDGELDVHVISSNTHSVGNCLSPFLVKHADEILAWGREHVPELAGSPSSERPWGEKWSRRADLVYVTAAKWIAGDPARQRAREEDERASGRIHLSSTAFTGIEVDLIDARRLRDDLTDPDVTIRVPARPTLIVNVDYAFGEQADEILSALIFLFGRKIRSVNVLGKAGALAGKRGDFLLPHATLLQTNDELYPLPNHDLARRDLESLSDGRGIHEGPILTVAGTLLQDRPLLLLYKRLWRCIGLEMEGSHFARRVVAAIETGLLDRDVRTRFAYYVSDAPLEPSSTLVEALRPEEGVPPLYAITRAMLRRILS